MLVLSRKKDEIIYIVNDETGDLITMKVLGGGRIGLDGPQKYKFIRKEVYDRSLVKPVFPSPETVIVDKAIHFSGSDVA